MQSSCDSLRQFWELPIRNKGTLCDSFQKIKLESNHFRVNLPQLSHIYIFHLKIVPQIGQKNSKRKNEIIQSILPNIKEIIENPIIRGNLIYSQHAPKKQDKTINFGDYIILLREVHHFDAKKNPKMLLGFINSAMKKFMQNIGYKQIGGGSRKYVNEKSKIKKQKLFIFSGFNTGLHKLQMGYFLKADTTFKVVRDQTVLGFINNLYKIYEHLDREVKRNIVKKSLINQVVMTNYGSTRYMKIQDVIFDDLTTKLVETENMTIPEYYLFKYNIVIKNLKQPLLFANPRHSKIKTYLIPQLCLMAGISTNPYAPGKLDSINDLCKRSVDARKKQIQNFVLEIQKQGDKGLLSSLGIKINTQFQKIQAKLMPYPQIQLGEKRFVERGRQTAFSMKNTPIYNYQIPVRLAVIFFDNYHDVLLTYLEKAFQFLKVKFSIKSIQADQSDPRKAITHIQNILQNQSLGSQLNFCLIILPNKLKTQYAKIKRIALLKQKIGCQVVLEGTLAKKNVHTIGLKILLQIIAKSGNIIFTSKPSFKHSKTMLVAFYNAVHSREGKDSYTLGICATLNQSYSKTFSKSISYENLSEIFQHKRFLLINALKYYVKKNSQLPEDIILLEKCNLNEKSDSVFQFFLEPTLSDMEKAYREMRPKLIYVYVKQNKNDRFFKQNGCSHKNPPFTTLVNDHITENSYQFFLMPHSSHAKNGCSIPTNYRVVYSDSSMEEGILQCILFSQCFNYANWQGSIKVPSVLNYASKCAKFDSQILQNSDVSSPMESTFYYI